MQESTEYKIKKKIVTLYELYKKWAKLDNCSRLNIVMDYDDVKVMWIEDKEIYYKEFSNEELESEKSNTLFNIGRVLHKMVMTMDDKSYKKYKDDFDKLEELILDLYEE